MLKYSIDFSIQKNKLHNQLKSEGEMINPYDKENTMKQKCLLFLSLFF